MNVQQIDEALGKFLAERYTPESVARLAVRFHRFGFVKFDATNRLVPDELQTAICEESHRLIEQHKERRNLLLSTTGNTPRRMSVVKSQEIEKSDLIHTLSRSEVLLGFLAGITREEIFPEVSEDERYLITHQEYKSDTHGWHWGDYSFALIWALRMPPIEHGGMLQTVPHTHWDKNNPCINQTLCEREINTYGLETGDLYLLRTDTTLHRTLPLSEDSTRTILNMTWAAKRDLEKKLVGDDRWWDNPEARAAHAVNSA